MHTFLFADLVGFTALSIGRGDEHAAEVLLSEATRNAARRGRPRLEPRGARTFRNARDPVVVFAASERPPLRERLRAAKHRYGCPHATARAETA